MAAPTIQGTPSTVNQTSNSTSWSHSHLLPSSSDSSRRGIILINVNNRYLPTAVTYGGETAVLVADIDNSATAADAAVAIYELTEAKLSNLTGGSSHTLAITMAESVQGASTFILLEGATQDSLTANNEQAGDAGKSTSPISLSVTPNVADSRIIDCMSWNEFAGTPTSPQTEILDSNPTGTLRALISHKSVSSTASTDMEWTPSGDIEGYAHAVVAIGVGVGQLEPTGITTDEAFGSSSFAGNIQSITGVASAESFGSQSIASLIWQITGITSGETFGSATMQAHPTLTGIASDEAFGSGEILGFVSDVGAITSDESFGTIQSILTALVATGITSGESFGTVQSVASVGAIVTSGIATGESIGSPAFRSFIQTMTGISSSEAFGTSVMQITLDPTGITTDEAFGSLEILTALVISAGIASAESVGGIESLAYIISATGITSDEAFGSIEFPLFVEVSGGTGEFVEVTVSVSDFVDEDTGEVGMIGISSEESFGGATVA